MTSSQSLTVFVTALFSWKVAIWHCGLLICNSQYYIIYLILSDAYNDAIQKIVTPKSAILMECVIPNQW